MRQIHPAAAGRREISEPAQGPAGLAGPDAVTAIAGLYAYPKATGAAEAAKAMGAQAAEAAVAAAAAVAGPDAARSWVRANMVTSADGAASLDGRSGGLSGDADRAVFAVLRSLADVILVGAQTARIERYRPVRPEEIWPALREGRPPTPPIAVLTSRMAGLEPDAPLLAAAPGQARTIVLTTEAAPAGLRSAAAQNAEVIVAGPDVVRPAAIISALAERGYLRVLTEGGPRLLGQIVAAGLLDELCLTVSPVLAGGWANRIVDPPAAGRIRAANAGLSAPQGPAGLRLAHVLEDGGYLLCRYLQSSEPE